jgi:fumarylpyruvate hydrolase
MSERAVDWSPPRLPVSDGRVFPVRHVWCVGRNYPEHAREMGADPERSDPVFFGKPAGAVTTADAVAFPPETGDLQHEVELVVLLGEGGRDLGAEAAAAAVFGYAVGVDLTRRDVQSAAKRRGQPWAMSKGFDQSAPVGRIVPAADWRLRAECLIHLAVDGHTRQRAVLGEMVWSVPELIVRLSRQVTLGAGDAIFTGTPAGVGSLAVGNRVQAGIEGLPALEFTIV